MIDDELYEDDDDWIDERLRRLEREQKNLGAAVGLLVPAVIYLFIYLFKH